PDHVEYQMVGFEVRKRIREERPVASQVDVLRRALEVLLDEAQGDGVPIWGPRFVEGVLAVGVDADAGTDEGARDEGCGLGGGTSGEVVEAAEGQGGAEESWAWREEEERRGDCA
ncbi:MAG: hypothetical protein Q9187_007024, partial [Circinaria calcarea]